VGRARAWTCFHSSRSCQGSHGGYSGNHAGGHRTVGAPDPSANQVGSSPTTTFTDAGLAAGTYYYRVRAADAAGNLSPSSNEVSAIVTAQPTNPGLVAAYGMEEGGRLRMEEGTGATVGDFSGQNNTGAATDTTWTTTGKHGKALSFNGTSSWVTVPHAETLRLKNALTYSAWVKPATEDGWRTVLAVTYNGTIITLYVNGTQVDQTPMTGDLLDQGGVLRLGGNKFWSDEFFSGTIDEVRIYNRVQTATEIQTDMNTPVGAAPASTAAQQRRMDAAADAPPTIDKLTVENARTVDGITVTST
jgi:hypothetical protein